MDGISLCGLIIVQTTIDWQVCVIFSFLVNFCLTERNLLAVTVNYKQFDLIFNGNGTEIILHFERSCIQIGSKIDTDLKVDYVRGEETTYFFTLLKRKT